MNFFEIRKYSGRNFNLVQEIHFFAVNISIIESKTLATITMHVFFETTIDIYINFILTRVTWRATRARINHYLLIN